MSCPSSITLIPAKGNSEFKLLSREFSVAACLRGKKEGLVLINSRYHIIVIMIMLNHKTSNRTELNQISVRDVCTCLLSQAPT